MNRIASSGIALALISGCINTASGDDQRNGSNTQPDSAVSPRAGAWNYRETSPVTSTCGSNNVPHGAQGGFLIDEVSAAGFRITPGDGTDPFTCSTTGGRFNCPNRATLVMDYRPSSDAIVTAHGMLAGTLSDTGHGTGQQSGSVSCTGAQCSIVLPTTCTFSVNFAITAN